MSLASAAFSLNSTISVAHGKSPFIVLFSRKPTLPLDLTMIKLSNCTFRLCLTLSTPRRRFFSDVCIALAKTNEPMACSADKHCCDVTFHTGVLVYINTTYFSLARGFSKKLAPKWVGLFPIE